MPDTIDEALEILHRTGGVINGGFNHGPMVAETLHVLGRGDEAIPWVERYKTSLEDHPEPHDPISREDWREALGARQRVGDWILFFDRELAEAPWPEVLNRWVPRLTPGLMASTGHPLIRTSHAVRSLVAAETPQRLHELADAVRSLVAAETPQRLHELAAISLPGVASRQAGVGLRYVRDQVP